MNPDIQFLQMQINELKDVIQSLRSANTLPRDISGALNYGLRITQSSPSDKLAETVTIMGTPAASAMDGFISLQVNGTFRNVPFYD